MGSHALLSPSGASRWLKCTPSARFEQRFEDRESDAAREGTQAHKLGEAMIGFAAGQISQADFDRISNEVKATKYYDAAMQEYCEQYCAFVMEKYYAAVAKTSDAGLYIEQKLDLQSWVPEGFGTGDIGIVADGDLIGIDLKYGKGVKVVADENPQLKIYALGFYERFKFLFAIERVTMIIYQPRIDSITEFTVSVAELLQWAEEELKPKAELAFKGEGEYVAGSHCRFCKGRVPCKAYAVEMEKLEKLKHSNELSDAEIADILGRVDDYVKWAKSVEEHALREAIANNKHWPGYKLVEGKSNRIIKDKDECARLLAQEGIEDYYKPQELKSLTELEKAVGKKRFAEIMAPVIEKPRGAPTLVPESDKRPVYNSATLDFEND